MPEEFVLDTSAAMAWCFEDESTDATDAFLAHLMAAGAIAPSIWPVEVASVLRIGERRKRLTVEQTAQFVQLLHTLPVTLDDQTALHAWDDTLTLARTHNLTVYDATYLELALRRGLPLATLDTDLRRVAAALGVTLL